LLALEASGGFHGFPEVQLEQFELDRGGLIGAAGRKRGKAEGGETGGQSG